MENPLYKLGEKYWKSNLLFHLLYIIIFNEVFMLLDLFENTKSRKRLSSPRCRSELIDSAWVVIVPGQKSIKKGEIDFRSMLVVTLL